MNKENEHMAGRPLDLCDIFPPSDGVRIEIFDSITSTNEYLKKQKTEHSIIKVCIAEHQTLGKGRNPDKTWHSPHGKNIYFSCAYPLKIDVSKANGLSLVAGIATVKAIENCFNKTKYKFELKWPNDILIKGSKLGGILVELIKHNDQQLTAIIGIGINVNMTEDKGDIDKSWISLKQLTNHDLNRNEIINYLMRHLFEAIKNFEQSGLTPFIDQWKNYDCLLNQEISLVHGNNLIKGLGNGINHLGELLVKLPNGSIKSFSSGDTSINRT